MGAIVSGPLSNGLNITQACITHTHKSTRGGGGEEKIWGMAHKQGMTLISPGASPHGKENYAGHISTAQEVLLVPDWDGCPGGLRCVGMSRSWSRDVLRAPTSHTCAGGCTHIQSHRLATFVLQVRKGFFQKEGIKT